MNRNFVWIMLAVAAVSVGCLLGGQGRTAAQAPANAATTEFDAAAAELDKEMLEQLKQVNVQLKELNNLFRSGKARVTVVINPEAP